MIFKTVTVPMAKDYIADFKDLFEGVLSTNGIRGDDKKVSEIYEYMVNYIDDSSAHVVGAFEDGCLLGFIWFYERIFNDESRLHINYFVVKQNYRGMGIGKRLIENVFEYARNNGIKKIELIVTKSNVNALGFYLNKGFEEERVLLCKDI